MLVLRDADLATLTGGVGAAQGKCWVKDLGSIQWNLHFAIFSLQRDIFERQMAVIYFLLGTGTCNEQCKVRELFVNF